MSGRSIRRIAVFTPLPPTRSGIAAYNHGFLPRLAEHLEVTAFVDDHVFGVVQPPEGVSVRPASYHDPRRFDLTVFHMGNHAGYHEYVHEALCRTPGLVVLHDMRMADFFGDLASRRPDLRDVTVPRSAASVPEGDIDFAALAPIVRRSRGVLVHSDAHADTLRRCFPGTPMFASRLALPPPHDVPEVPLGMLGWPAASLIVGSFGSIEPHKRIDRVIAIVAGLHAVGTDAKLIVSGWASSPTEMDKLEALVARHGITDHVRFFTDSTEAETSALYGLCDVVVDLRDPYTGAASMSVVTALGHGVPTVTTASVEFTEVAHPLLHHVSVDSHDMVTDCTGLLANFARHKATGTASRDVAGDQLRQHNQRRSAAVVHDHLSAIEACLGSEENLTLPLLAADAKSLVSGVPPLTVVADLTATTGLMEYGRSLVNVLHGASVPLAWDPYWQEAASHDPRRDTAHLHRSLPRSREADIELWLHNINEFPAISDDELRPPGTDRRVIASWFWELPVVQEPFLSQFGRPDEIWVGSPFVERTFRQYCDAPIVVVPMPIDTLPNERLRRHDFGLSDDDVLFFLDFDANSHPARKNPLGLIEAFRRAFTAADRDRHGRRPRLVLKSLHLDKDMHRRTASLLRSKMAAIDGIVIDDELDRRELDALVNCCDVYVSLHRAEGLGIGMLEAMHLGKPVISPSYPDKWLFPASEVGLSVPALMRPIDATDTHLLPEYAPTYSEGLPWVEPDIAVAARHMRRLFDEPGLRDRRGARGARLVREHYNVAAALEVMVSRLRSTQPSRLGV